MIDRMLSHYRILEKLGAGGMGVVYKAQDVRLDRFVALKVLPPERLADEERNRRFVQEAKAASALNHPNIITIHDIGEADGEHFIAVEFVAGKTLGELIGRKGLPLKNALSYAAQIADALGKAHAAGIVHRDLKPTNVLPLQTQQYSPAHSRVEGKLNNGSKRRSGTRIGSGVLSHLGTGIEKGIVLFGG